MNRKERTGCLATNRRNIMNYSIKWLLIVGLNSVSGFFWGSLWGADNGKGIEHWLGMIAGVVTWYLVYFFLDDYLLKTGRLEKRRKLVLSASLRIPFQLTVIPDFIAGVTALLTCQYLGLTNGFLVSYNDFLASYSVTMVTGLYLGIICLVLYILIDVILHIRNRYIDSAIVE